MSKKSAHIFGIRIIRVYLTIFFLIGFQFLNSQESFEKNDVTETTTEHAGINVFPNMPTDLLKKPNKDVFYYWISTGEVLKRQQKFDLSRDAFAEALKVAVHISDSAQINTLLQLGEVNMQLIEYSEAYQQLVDCTLIAQRSHRYIEAQKAYILLGDLFTKAENLAAAYDNYKKGWVLSTGSTKVELRVQLLGSLAESGFKLNKKEEAIGFIHSAEELMQPLLKQNDPKLENFDLFVNVLRIKSFLQWQMNDIQSALKTLESASELCQKIKDDDRNTEIVSEMCEILRASDNSSLAVSKLKALQNAVHTSENSAFIQSNLGDILFDKKNWLEARTHYFTAFKLVERIVDSCRLTVDRNDKSITSDGTQLTTINYQLSTKNYQLKQHIAHQLFLTHLNIGDAEGTKKYFTIDTNLHAAYLRIENLQREASNKLNFNNEFHENSFNSLKMRDNRFLLIFGSIGSMLLVILLSLVLQNRTKNYKQLMLRNAEIQAQNKKLEESNEILTQFAYVAAHDLKEPLRSIGSYIGILQIKYLKDLPPNAGEYMQFINSGVKRMYLLLNDLLELSQVIRQQPGAEVVRPEEVLNDVRSNLNSAIELKHAQLDYAANMPGVRMNRNHLMQLFQNLIGNALKFTTNQPRVLVYAFEEPTRIIFTVADNGIGIKKDYSSKIFVLFQQLNKKGSYEGTGIGLTICKNIVEKYNGNIWFESEENVGTKFHFSIPV